MNEVAGLSHAQWRKSTYSNGQGGNCVIYGELPNGHRALKDSKLGDSSPVLVFDHDEWSAFIKGVKDGEFD